MKVDATKSDAAHSDFFFLFKKKGFGFVGDQRWSPTFWRHAAERNKIWYGKIA
jgi:hypothetical protein